MLVRTLYFCIWFVSVVVCCVCMCVVYLHIYFVLYFTCILLVYFYIFHPCFLYFVFCFYSCVLLLLSRLISPWGLIKYISIYLFHWKGAMHRNLTKCHFNIQNPHLTTSLTVFIAPAFLTFSSHLNTVELYINCLKLCVKTVFPTA